MGCACVTAAGVAFNESKPKPRVGCLSAGMETEEPAFSLWTMLSLIHYAPDASAVGRYINN